MHQLSRLCHLTTIRETLLPGGLLRRFADFRGGINVARRLKLLRPGDMPACRRVHGLHFNSALALLLAILANLFEGEPYSVRLSDVLSQAR